MNQLNKQQSGFTLVEIAIVLVIIGLLLGGVLKGQELINSAKVKNMVNDFRTISSLPYGYQDRFKSLPGDQTQDQLNAAFGTGTATACKGSAGCTPNNGRIDGNWYDVGSSTSSASEAFLFWQHVRLANLAAGASNVDTDEYRPRNADGGLVGIEGVVTKADGTPDPFIAGMRGSFFVCSDGILGRYVKQIDTTMDDGNTASGSVQAVATSSTRTRGATAVATASILDGSLYTVCAAY